MARGNRGQDKNMANSVVWFVVIPTTPEAVKMFEENGGRLTRNADFGYDPLAAIEHAFESRNTVFQANQPTGRDLFSSVVHGEFLPLEQAFKCFFMN